MSSVVIFTRFSIAVDLDLRVALQDGLRDAEPVAVLLIDRENWLRIGTEVFDHARAIHLLPNIISVLYDREYVLNSPRHYTTILPCLSVERVSLARLGRAEKDDGSVLSFHKGLYYGLHALTVKLVLSLHFAEDIVEVEDTCVVAIRGTCLTDRKRKRVSEQEKKCAIYFKQNKTLTGTCPAAMLPSAVH